MLRAGGPPPGSRAGPRAAAAQRETLEKNAEKKTDRPTRTFKLRSSVSKSLYPDDDIEVTNFKFDSDHDIEVLKMDFDSDIPAESGTKKFYAFDIEPEPEGLHSEKLRY
jgi:hypothetical protein